MNLRVTFIMCRDRGPAGKPNVSVIETSVVLPMQDNIAADVLLNGHNSQHLSHHTNGVLYSALCTVAQLQGYVYGGFCKAEPVAIRKDIRSQQGCKNPSADCPRVQAKPVKPSTPRHTGQFVYRRIGCIGTEKTVDMMDFGDLHYLKMEIDSIRIQRATGKPGLGIYDPELEGMFAAADACELPGQRMFSILARMSDRELFLMEVEVSTALRKCVAPLNPNL